MTVKRAKKRRTAETKKQSAQSEKIYTFGWSTPSRQPNACEEMENVMLSTGKGVAADIAASLAATFATVSDAEPYLKQCRRCGIIRGV